ncbi:cytochrome aa3 quinol oxidase subunit II [Paenibacillus sediminis]|uniref:Quinol oxidase subunit 2 n=1 Tax=Paenibacillus sediminis TaxID=664909 RepID=A0ABS4H4T2_9BACL|nr:cytochrome aa3 quinol oxidase subunit II [Paenibacillus sediminis]MBP1937544.1 cytochrome aa3-600 menaquinol oxidase subunit 2 [Paenibacillus sediminis]
MKNKGPLFVVFLLFAVLLSGCSPLTVLDPKGPVAKTQSDTIMFSVFVMAGILAVVYILYIYMLTKYRATKANEDYVPPHIEGSKWLELIWTIIPVIIVIVLSVVSVRSTAAVETTPKGYENEKPLVIYASSSNWKWHFSYPEEGIETVNYVNIPTNRTVEFRLYSYGPITSFWIPQLGGQKYAMSDMVTKLRLVAEHADSYLGRNSNFNGKGYAQMEFEAQAMSPADYRKWVHDVKTTAPALTKEEFNTLLNTPFVGRKTYSSTHLSFSPPPMEGKDMSNMNMDHKTDEKDSSSSTKTDGMNMNHMDGMNMDSMNMDHTQHSNN